MRVAWVSPGVAGGVVSQAPIRHLAGVLAGRHDHVSGDRAAQSDDRIRPVAGSCRKSELARGLVTLPVCGCVVAALAARPVAAVSGACAAWAAASKWQARVSNLRAIAMVAIFFPRRLAMAA